MTTLTTSSELHWLPLLRWQSGALPTPSPSLQ